MGQLADEANGPDETDVAEMALRMNALFYFDCLGRQELKNIAHNGLWIVYAVTWSDGMGWMDHTPYIVTTTRAHCGANNQLPFQILDMKSYSSP